MPGIFEFLFGRGDRTKRLPTLDPSQQQGLQQVLSQLGSLGQGGYGQGIDYLSKLVSGDPGALSEFEAPYRQEFEQKTLPGIAERFAGINPMGGGLSSSGFGQALGGAGAQLQSNLAGLHGALRQGAAGQLANQFNQLAGLGLGTRTFENLFQPGSGGFLGNLFSGISGGLGQGAGQAGGYALLSKLLPFLGIR